MIKAIRFSGALVALALVTGWLAPAAAAEDEIPYTDTFFQEDCRLKPRGVNDYYLNLKPGCYLLLQGEEEDDEGGTETVVVFIKVLPGTRVVDGVRCAIVREMEWIDGELVEISWNYFAICRDHGGVFYFGEEVDIYEDGEVVSHDGAWLAGENGAKAGLIMPGLPLNGSRYYQEIAPGVALDRAEHLSNTATVGTDAGTFLNCLLVAETTPLDPEELSMKAYARGIGLVQDGTLLLTAYGCDNAFQFEPEEGEEE